VHSFSRLCRHFAVRAAAREKETPSGLVRPHPLPQQRTGCNSDDCLLKLQGTEWMEKVAWPVDSYVRWLTGTTVGPPASIRCLPGVWSRSRQQQRGISLFLEIAMSICYCTAGGGVQEPAADRRQYGKRHRAQSIIYFHCSCTLICCHSWYIPGGAAGSYA
jgi:hypothetical protein